MDTPLPAPDIQEATYDRDFHSWTERQAALLRAGRLDEADIAHIADEIEDLGKSTKAALSSQIRRVLIHLMKLQASPPPSLAPAGRARSRMHGPKSRRCVARETVRARRVAEADLAARREQTGSIAGLAYGVDQVLGSPA